VADVINSYLINPTDGCIMYGQIQNLQYAGTDPRYAWNFKLLYSYSTDGSSWSSWAVLNSTTNATYEGGSAGTGYAWASFSGLRPSSFDNNGNWLYLAYDISVDVYWNGVLQGTWYPPTSIIPYIPYATFSNQSTQKTTITFDYTNAYANLALYEWNSSSWTPISNSGLPYTTQGITNGTRITITNLIPNTEYDFYARSYVLNNQYYTTYSGNQLQASVTQPWATIPSQPTLVSRVPEGYILNWGDNGLESYGFNYCLQVDYNYTYLYTGHDYQYFYSNDYGVQHSFRVCVGYYGYGQNGVYAWYISEYYTNASSYYSMPNIPTNVSVVQPPKSFSVDLYYSWGTGATSISFRWSTDQINWNNYSNQSHNLYPSPNYNIGVGTIGNKYFQVRSALYDGSGYVYSDWVNANPFPILIINNLRPDDFYWITNIITNGNVYGMDFINKRIYVVTSSEWNSFTNRINQFRLYKGLSSYNFTTVYRDTPFTAAIFNEAANALSDLSLYFNGYTQTYTVSSGTKIRADYFQNMKNCMNSIT
jgi:hypothetical protein